MSKFYKHSVLSAFILFMLMGMTSPVQAESAEDGGGYWIPDEKVEEATKLLKQGKPLGELEIEKDTAQKKESFQTLNGWLNKEQQNSKPYIANMAPPIKTADGWIPPAFEYDHILTPEECQRHPDSGSDTGYLKNRFSYCWSKIAAYQVPVKCFAGICINEGVQFQFTVIGYGSNQSRNMRLYYVIDDIFVSHPSLNGAKLKVDMVCESKVNPGDCQEDPDYPATERTIAHWKNSNFGTEVFTSEAPERTDTNPDRKSFMEFWPELTFTHRPNKFQETIDGIKQSVRFDSAGYILDFPRGEYYRQGAIFNKAMPILDVPITKPEFSILTDVALHWKSAMENPDQTRPQVAGKYIPGAVGTTPLTRMYTRRHQEDYNDNRNKTRRICNAEFRNEDRTGLQCDEFPFASSWEGSATNGGNNFSVALISAESNQAGGAWLSGWYVHDRVLDGDQYYVQVEAPEKIATIRSEGQPQDGQDNRSSDNFTIGNIPSYANKLQWKIIDGPINATFDVMKDISFGIDETIFYDLQDGSETEIETGDDLYIARPENTNGESFTIEVYAIP